MIRAALLLLTLAGCAEMPETRECLVSFNGACLEYDTGSADPLYFQQRIPQQ